MTAPSLVLLGHGGADPRVAQVSQALRVGLTELRPGLDVHAAFMDNPPTALHVINKLTQRGVTEIVLAPLTVADAFSGDDDLATLLTTIRAAYPGLQVVASQPIGPAQSLLTVVDRQLRTALRSRQVTELDGLVFLAESGTDVRSHSIIARRARTWAHHHRLPSITAFGGTHGPSAAEAIRSLWADGRRHIAVGSWFLSPSEEYRRQRELALQAGAVAVSAPLADEPEVLQEIIGRYVVSAMDLVDLEPLLEDRPQLTVVGA